MVGAMFYHKKFPGNKGNVKITKVKLVRLSMTVAVKQN